MATWGETYDNADRTLFLGAGRKNSLGVAQLDYSCPFYLLRLEGVDYYETRPAVWSAYGDAGLPESLSNNLLIGTQVIDIDSPTTYNTNVDNEPLFEMHPLV